MIEENSFEMIAKTLFGLEEVLADELKALGAKEITVGQRMVSFEGDRALLYKCNLHLRTALRILTPVHFCQARDEKGLYKGIQQVDWSSYFDVDQTFAIDVVSNSEIFKHSKFAALKAKDAIVDQFRDKFERRPSVDVNNPDLRIHLHINRERITVQLDSSGQSLHMRGYRTGDHRAPINEVLAAGMIALSGWDKTGNFVDGMCGTGTILIEACMLARNYAPGMHRRFGFMNWKDFDEKLWEQISEEARAMIIPPKAKFFGSDRSALTLKVAEENLDGSRQHAFIELMSKPFANIEVPEGGGILIMNPPYGERLKEAEMNDFYEMIGDTLKQNFAGYSAWILSANAGAMKRVGLRPSKKMKLINGALECKYYKYEMYSGTRKVKKE